MAPQFRLLLLLPFLASLSIQAQDVRVVTRVVTDSVPAWKTWKENGFSMNYPGQWSADMNVQGDTVVLFSKRIGKGDAKTPFVSVFVQGVDGKFDPVEKRSRNSAVTDLELVPDEGPNVGTRSRTEYRCKVSGNDLHFLEQVVEKGSRSYLLTYSAPVGSYEEYLFLAEAMLNSFSAPADR